MPLLPRRLGLSRHGLLFEEFEMIDLFFTLAAEELPFEVIDLLTQDGKLFSLFFVDPDEFVNVGHFTN